MGYAGYAPAKLPPAKKTEVEAALAGIKNSEALAIIHKLVYNASCQPKEDKFRRVRLTNPKIQAALVAVPGAVDALCAMGWALDGEDLAISSGKYMTMSEVRAIDAAIEFQKKADADADRLRNIVKA